eukprot:2640714-Pleurochrysis_carterae.AAC.1
MASRSRLPMIYVPLEAVISKWYGEGARMHASRVRPSRRLPAFVQNRLQEFTTQIACICNTVCMRVEPA